MTLTFEGASFNTLKGLKISTDIAALQFIDHYKISGHSQQYQINALLIH